ASRQETDILNVAALGLALLSRGDTNQAEICCEEALHLFITLCQISSKYNSRTGYDEFTYLSSAFTNHRVISNKPENLAWMVD
ncbi:hypothetical protein, partial [Pectobacterium brasiliense]|uniref:hypothetical protein n=1 Tax=Pectobacterium brasiliense TaxID=180957 RepID=UPI00196982A1